MLLFGVCRLNLGDCSLGNIDGCHFLNGWRLAV
jgi:hypothetical protein